MNTLPSFTPENLQFVLLSFEGPDQYSMAGGLGMRMKELALELAGRGFTAHHVFVGDPQLPPVSQPQPNLTLHRWSQWLSERHSAGVYQGEEEKIVDWNSSVPRFVAEELIAPAAERGLMTAVLGEEWHTAQSMCDLSDLLWIEGLRSRAVLIWTANNVLGFERVDWPRLDFCTQIATVSRYMKHLMWEHGVNAIVVPNGIPERRLATVPPAYVKRIREAVGHRDLLFKIGRFTPDKRWITAIRALGHERAEGRDVALVMRGGIEAHAEEVLSDAEQQELRVHSLKVPRTAREVIQAFAEAPEADIYNVSSFMSDEAVSLFYRAADGVLANSGHEPFGLVGLEVMASGGIAFVGSTGEDYAVPYLNAVVLDSDDPAEITTALQWFRQNPEAAARMRKEARATAKRFTWGNVIRDVLLTKLAYVAIRQGSAL